MISLSMFGQFSTAEMQDIFPDTYMRFVIREIKEFTSQNGNQFINFELEVTGMDDDFARFNGKKQRMSFPIFPDMDQNTLESQGEKWQKYFFQSGDEFVTVMRALGVPEDELDSPDWSSLTGLEITVKGKAYDRSDGKGKEWKPWKKTVKLAE